MISASRTIKARVFPALVLLLSIAGTALAQNPRGRGMGPGGANAPQGTIVGSVRDSSNGEALYRASVSIRRLSDSVLVTGAITERDGSFSISGIRPGRYFARIAFVGFVTRLIGNLEVAANGTVDLGKVMMVTNAALGAEVTVNAQRDFMTQAIDRTIYKTAELKVAAGGSISDLLRNIPQIDVDPDGNVSLRGSQNVVIQINGRPTMVTGTMLAEFLRGLPADAVERIEVIPNPSAKYDPDGMSGIINIVLKQNSELGLSGGVNGSVGTHDNYSIGGTINYGSGPWNVFANYGFNYNDRENTGSYSRVALVPDQVPVLEQASHEENRNPFNLLSTTIDYKINKEHTITLAATGSIRTQNETQFTNYDERDTNRVLTRRYDRSAAITGDGTNADVRLSHKWVIDPARQELSSEVRFSSDRRVENSAFTNRNLTLDGGSTADAPGLQNTVGTTRNRSLAFQTDYTMPLGAATRMEAGYKGDLEMMNDDFSSESFDYTGNLFQPDVGLNNTFDYRRTIHAVYSTLGQDFGHISAQAGLRAEQAYTTFDMTTTGQTYHNDYFSLFPSAFLMYKPNDDLQFKASVSRRINRPSPRALNPFTNVEDLHFRRTGNPYLKPEYTSAYEFATTLFADRTSVTLTAFYRHTTDVMRQYGYTDTTGVTYLTWANFATNSTYGGDLTATVRLGDWFNGFVFASAYQNVTDASNVDTTFSTNGLQWMLRANGNVTIVPGLDLQATYFLHPAANVEGAHIGTMQGMDVALQQKLFNDKGRIGLRLSDPFNTQKFTISRIDPTAHTEVERKWTSRILALTFSYTFGTPDRNQRQRQQQPGNNNPNMMDME
ncbi:MAG: TonB-dependent receptor [Bacteroidetes bacterium]|nr:TonB-dependent receptor [Bacteroidota bacterium]